jgi:hypothetical protein
VPLHWKDHFIPCLKTEFYLEQKTRFARTKNKMIVISDGDFNKPIDKTPTHRIGHDQRSGNLYDNKDF